jgi:hypothetical protein
VRILQGDISVQSSRPEELEVAVHRLEREKDVLQGNLMAGERNKHEEEAPLATRAIPASGQRCRRKRVTDFGFQGMCKGHVRASSRGTSDRAGMVGYRPVVRIRWRRRMRGIGASR